jgi:iron complex transport system ATP-binding protein
MTMRLDQIGLSLGGKPVLVDLSATLQPGRVTAILGPNGAGKTSLLRVMAGLCTPDIGKALLDDQPVGGMDHRARAKRIGYLPQEANPVWNLAARDLVALGRLPHRQGWHGLTDGDWQAVNDAMTATHTLELADRLINAMSGGERARVQFARVLAGNPDWILADEPLANLDPPHQRDLLALLGKAAASGKGVAVVLHGQNAAARVADDIILMRQGRIVAMGTKAEVLTEANLAQTYGMAFAIIAHQGALIIKPTG